MKTFLAALSATLLACCQASPVPAATAETNPDGTVTITLTKEQAEYCEKHGSCMVVPIELIREAIRRAANSCGKET